MRRLGAMVLMSELMVVLIDNIFRNVYFNFNKS